MSLQVLVFLLFGKMGWRKGVQVSLMVMHILQLGSSSFPNVSTLHMPCDFYTTPSFLLMHLSLVQNTKYEMYRMCTVVASTEKRNFKKLP